MEVKVDPRTAPVPGMYRIQYIKPGGRITLESQMLLFSRHISEHGTTLYFSARPTYGTQDFRADNILSMIKVDSDQVYVNWDPRKNGKPVSWRYVR